MQDHDIVEVYKAGELAEAYFLRDMLGNSGIEARVVGDSISTGLGLPPVGETAPSLWVRKADEKQARELLVEYEKRHAGPRSETSTKPQWQCSGCHEMVDDDLDVCWNCEQPRHP
jgi:hypothetical protein